jgi:hypothetical protein
MPKPCSTSPTCAGTCEPCGVAIPSEMLDKAAMAFVACVQPNGLDLWAKMTAAAKHSHYYEAETILRVAGVPELLKRVAKLEGLLRERCNASRCPAQWVDDERTCPDTCRVKQALKGGCGDE